MNSFTATAKAHPNFALVKYWGKRDKLLNLPDVGSISVTIDDFHTTTAVSFDDTLSVDQIFLNGNQASKQEAKRIGQFLDMVRNAAALKMHARVVSDNNFPTAAGLASSASGFAALAAASCKAAQLDCSLENLSQWARRGSGSAPRSLLGGFVELYAGEHENGSDCDVRQLLDEHAWPLEIIIVQTTRTPKKIGSTEGMIRSKQTSHFYQAWLEHQSNDLEQARQAILQRDFSLLGQIMERSCFKMHGLMMSSVPPLIYWNSTTLSVLDKLWELRDQNCFGYATIDAGPHVKILCQSQDSQKLCNAINSVEDVIAVSNHTLGPGISWV